MAIIKQTISTSSATGIKGYLQQDKKTEITIQTGMNCDIETFDQDFELTKKLYSKTQGRSYYHISQSFHPNEKKLGRLNAQECHQLGVELAKKHFSEKGYQVAVVTHTDTDHLHNHIIINSVNMTNGTKYKDKMKDFFDLKRYSNRQCEREGLKDSIIDYENRAKDKETLTEKKMKEQGKTTWKQEIKDIINSEKNNFNNMKDFTQHLKEKYNIKTRWSPTSKTITYTPTDRKQGVRGKRLGADYSKKTIESDFKQKTIKRRDKMKNEVKDKINKTTDKVAILKDLRAKKQELGLLENKKVDDEIKQMNDDLEVKIENLEGQIEKQLDNVNEKFEELEELEGLSYDKYETEWKELFYLKMELQDQLQEEMKEIEQDIVNTFADKEEQTKNSKEKKKSKTQQQGMER